MFHEMHNNSLTAFQTLKREDRRHVILRIYEAFGSLTDREVAKYLGFFDLNAVRPRITEMIDEGLLIECGGKRDDLTGKNVRTVRVKLPSENKQPELFGLSQNQSYSRGRVHEVYH